MKIIKLRNVNSTAIGVTIPKDFISKLNIKKGHYLCNMTKKEKVITITLRELEDMCDED